MHSQVIAWCSHCVSQYYPCLHRCNVLENFHSCSSWWPDLIESCIGLSNPLECACQSSGSTSSLPRSKQFSVVCMYRSRYGSPMRVHRTPKRPGEQHEFIVCASRNLRSIHHHCRRLHPPPSSIVMPQVAQAPLHQKRCSHCDRHCGFPWISLELHLWVFCF